MIIKKFQGKTEEEALENAKKELGESIVIMNTKSLKKKGIFSLFKSKGKEITVALEEEKEPAVVKALPVKQNNEDQEIAINQELVRQTAIEVLQQKKDAKERAEGISKITEASPALEEKLDSLQSLLEQQFLQKKETQEENDVEEKNADESTVFLKLIHQVMTDNEIEQDYANQIIDEIDKSRKANMPVDYILSNIYQKMILKFGQKDTIKPTENGAKIVFFIGPTGVGKTTTIAKIASKFSVEEKKKVALLTADTYRIAAAEQLRTYANILDVPCRVIYTSEEIKNAYQDFKDYDYILIDTAGHSYQNEEQCADMGKLVHSIDGEAETEVYLVLSATTKYKDLLKITSAYSDIVDYKLIFTKLDETTAVGNLLNVHLQTGAPLSYVTYGQNVPEDIEEFNVQATVKQLLGGTKSE